MKSIPMTVPDVSGNEKKYLNECIDSGAISSSGVFLDRFSGMCASYIGTTYALPVSSGTAALHLSLLALGIGRGDEVILPDLTFAARANAIASTGATPVCVDIDPDTWNIDPDMISSRITRRTKAIMPVHLYGNPRDMHAIMDIARGHDLFVIEDAAEAFGSSMMCSKEYAGSSKEQKVGSIGDVGCFSFAWNKIITTGEGGMVVTNNIDLYDRMKILRDHGHSPRDRYVHHVIGYNYRMTNMQAAVGVAQLERIDEIVEKKKCIGRWYLEETRKHPGLVLQKETDHASSVYWMPTVCVSDESSEIVMNRLAEHAIDVRKVFSPLHRLAPYAQGGEYPQSERVASCGISLPSSLYMKKEDVEHIVNVVSESTL